MSEKRFIFELVEISDVDNDKLVEVITDKEKNYSYGELDEVVGLLNHLHQENQQLKHYKLYEDNKRLQTIIADLKEENEQLKEELQRFKKYVFSQDNILCYKCEHCIKKDIYVVDCEMKGEVDVHGLCGWFREVKV